MKRSLPFFLTLILSITFLASPITLFGQTPTMVEVESGEEEDDAPVERVARLSFLEGDVSFLRAGVNEWVAAA
ncbi:MAG TPA: hypothetical protein VFQ92_16205, partial [Blastocatellia bacterium]|nr:hypothetical protein [Blastocatellia bacterium]